MLPVVNSRKLSLVVCLTLWVWHSSIAHGSEPDSLVVPQDDKPAKTGFVQKVLNYVAPADIESIKHTEDKFAIIGGPFYNTDSKLGVGIVGSSEFRLKGSEHLLLPSRVSMISNFSIKGFVDISLRGNLFLKGDAMRLNADLRYEYSPTNFWGMGYDNNSQDELKTPMTTHKASLDAHCLFRLAKRFYAGPTVKWLHCKSNETSRPELFEDQKHIVNSLGVGVSLDYDTRDNITAPSSGVYLHLAETYVPNLGINDYHYWNTDLRFNAYCRLWRGAILAGDLRGKFNFGETSWATMSLLGDSYSMRGYYPGRYRDRHMLTMQLELRQKLWKWLGMAVWGGCGSVFHKASDIHVLPNAGIGLRWEFRKNVHIRVDYGIGRKGESGFIFNINEAF